MCGLAGSTAKREMYRVQVMLNDMHERGPDETSGFKKDWIKVGFNRLSIVDIETGHQPFISDCRRYVTFCNGEVYNHRKLRRELESKGCLFRSNHSDIEVLAKGLAIYGLKYLNKIDGMFAVIHIDQKSRSVVLARDKNGERPIFYTIDDRGELSFCSEFRPLFNALGSYKPDKNAWKWFLAFKAPPFDRSIDKRIKQVPPGSFLVWKNGKSHLDSWVELPRPDSITHLSYKEKVIHFDKLISQSVKDRCDLDVGFGAYLSGGVDSSLISVLASRNTGKTLKTFTLVYKDKIYNKNEDKVFAKKISQIINSEHHEISLSAKEFSDEYPKIVEQYSQPTCVTNSTWFISKHIGKKLKVALTGDGPDELLGSYRLHRIAYLIDCIKKNKSLKGANPEEVKKARSYCSETLATIIEKECIFDSTCQNNVAGPEIYSKESLGNLIGLSLRKIKDGDIFEKVLAFEWSRLFNEGVLHYSDVLGLKFSVENRLPFLAKEITSFIQALKSTEKYEIGYSKKILKDCALNYLPENLVHRKKEGFIEPNIFWLEDKLYSWAEGYFKKAQKRDLGIIKWKENILLLQEFKRTRSFSVGKKIWLLLNVAIWEEKVLINA